MRGPAETVRLTGVRAGLRPGCVFLFHAYPVIMRFIPLMGEMMNAASSLPKRSPPEARSSSIMSDVRKKASPNAAPPMGVAMMSLADGYSHSMNSSHMALPPMAKSYDCQKLYPLERAAL